MTRADRWVAMLLILIGLLLMGWRVWGNPMPSACVSITVEGREVLNFQMEPGMERTYTIKLKKGEARVEVKNGAVRLVEMDEICPRNICTHTGWIRKTGESIVCVPNNLLVRVLGAEGKSVDALSR